MNPCRVNIAATFTAEPIKGAAELLLDIVQVPTEIEFAPFSQVFQELLSPASSFSQNSSGVNIALMRLEDLATETEKPEAFEKNAADLIAAVKTAAANHRVPLVLAICPPSGALLANATTRDNVARIESEISNALDSLSGINVIRSESLLSGFALSAYDNPQGHRLGAVPYSDKFYSILGYRIARIVFRLLSPSHKVIVLDCDQTLWKGVCGEDGPHGININSSNRFLQEFMLEQHAAGMLLCLCSKNNEPDVLEVFRERSDMPLKLEHIVSSRINWSHKSENIRALSRELELGLDSFIFVDDDPVVCAEVEANCPDVLVVRVPPDDERIPDLLREHWAFVQLDQRDQLRVTSEDANRTAMYRENAARQRVLEQASNLDDFLRDLGLQCDISPMSDEQLPRVAQLTQRTNQFNSTTIRRQENEIQSLLKEDGGKCLVVHVRDRFGDYGLVGALIYFEQEDKVEVASFLLSCRALGRGVEHRMLAKLGEVACDGKLKHVAVNFIPTQKNLPIGEFLENTGSDFKTSITGQTVYLYPADIARQLTVDASGVPKSPALETKSEPAPIKADTTEVSLRRRYDGLWRIATELHRVDALTEVLKRDETSRPNLKVAYVAPHSEHETRLVRIWESLLNVRPIGVLDNYFELGGDSLLAVSLFVDIEQEFGQVLSLATLFPAPTIRGLAKVLSGADKSNEPRYLVPIQPDGTRPSLFCMHAAGGNVLFYRDLAGHLGNDQPVYGLQARESEETGAYLDQMEEMSARYSEEILAFQPEGPFYLCGSSFGGLVAFEIAQQLKARGHEIGLLALFDTYGPGYPQTLAASSGLHSRVRHFTTRLKGLQGQLHRMDLIEKVRFLRKKAGKVVLRLKRTWKWKRNEFQIKYSQATNRELPKDLQRNHKAIQRALDSYVPKPYDGKLTLFRASTQPDGIVPDQYLGWMGLASGGIDLLESDGLHGAMTVDPYARSLAKQLLPCLGPSESRSTEMNSTQVAPLVTSIGAGVSEAY